MMLASAIAIYETYLFCWHFSLDLIAFWRFTRISLMFGRHTHSSLFGAPASPWSIENSEW